MARVARAEGRDSASLSDEPVTLFCIIGNIKKTGGCTKDQNCQFPFVLWGLLCNEF